MIEQWKRDWKELKESRPGHRFEERYRRARRDGGGGGVAHFLRPILGILVAAAGVLLMPAPGPGWLVFVIGLSLLASDFLWMARILDGAEVRLRAAARALERWWKKSGPAVRIAASTAVGLVLVASAWGIWRLLFAK